jgi:uncharacterized protein YndB with AHSA1/START domain
MPDRVEREILLPAAAPEEVWASLSDPSGWLADEAYIEPCPGGEARFRTGDVVRSGWVEEIVEAERLTFWWARGDEPASRVELMLEQVPDGTVVRVVETRPLDVLDLVGIPLRGVGGPSFGPALVAA